MGILDGVKDFVVDKVTPESIKRVNQALDKTALTVSEPIKTEPLPLTGQAAADAAAKEARDTAEAARQEAIKRGN
jgi:hypothetical protein